MQQKTLDLKKIIIIIMFKKHSCQMSLKGLMKCSDSGYSHAASDAGDKKLVSNPISKSFFCLFLKN